MLVITFTSCIEHSNSKQVEASTKKARNYANIAAKKIANKCIRVGRTQDFYCNVEKTTYDRKKNKYIIHLEFGWKGSYTQIDYWVKGALITDPDGCDARWRLYDHNELLTACVQDCYLDCIDY